MLTAPIPRLAAYFGGSHEVQPMADKTAGRSRADTQLTASAARDAAIKDQIAKESAAFDARTLKLRALRLAREAEEAAAKPAAPPKPRKKAVRRITAG